MKFGGSDDSKPPQIQYSYTHSYTYMAIYSTYVSLGQRANAFFKHQHVFFYVFDAGPRMKNRFKNDTKNMVESLLK